MYQIKGYFINGHSGAVFDTEAAARHSFAQMLTRFSSEGRNLDRLELWDDNVLIAVFESHGICEPCKDHKRYAWWSPRKTRFTF